MRLKRTAFAALAALAALTGGGMGARAASEPAPPRRIVSLNLCTDQILMDLVEPQRIAALSHLAADPALSAAPDRARSFPATRGSAEEVLGLDPDLVVTMEYSTPATVGLLRRLGKRVLIVPFATDFEGIRIAIRTVAAAVGDEKRGARQIAAFDRRLESAASLSSSRPTALAYQINSLAAGPATLLDAVIERSGFDNLARRRELSAASRLPLETLVADPPDVLILANAPDEFRTASADNLRHPALRRIMAARPSLHLAMPLWLCGTPHVADAVERLAALRRARLAANAPLSPPAMGPLRQ